MERTRGGKKTSAVQNLSPEKGELRVKRQQKKTQRSGGQGVPPHQHHRENQLPKKLTKKGEHR